jgi:HK97 gp10 family phage protein
MQSNMYKTNGLKDLEKAMSQLGKQAGFAALTGALRDASRPIIKSTRARAPSKTGNLKRGIIAEVFKGKGKRDDVATLHIGFSIKRKNSAFYGSFLEKGTKSHRIPGSKSGRGRNKRDNKAKVSFGGKVYSNVMHPGIRAKPMLLPGFQAGYKQSIPIFVKRLRERIILQAIKKYGKVT